MDTDSYKWTFNLGINPIHYFWMNVWIGNRCWSWYLNHPLTIEYKNNNKSDGVNKTISTSS